MSSVIGSVGKIFSTVGNSAAKVSRSVAGVGATVFTAGAASGSSFTRGGFGAMKSVAGTGAVGNVLTGAAKQAGHSGLFNQAAPGSVGGLGGLLDNPLVGGAIAGYGEGLARKQELKAVSREKQADRDFLKEQRKEVRDSYSVDPSVYAPQHPDAGFSTKPRPEFDPETGRIKVR